MTTYTMEHNAHDESEDGFSDDEMDEAEFLKRTTKFTPQKCRMTVCGETTKVSPNWISPEFAKSPRARERIRHACARNFLFDSLAEKTNEKLINAFREHRCEAGRAIITEGADVLAEDPGLFILESGHLEVYKNIPGGDKQKVHEYSEVGQSFGELALLYNCPRQATVISSVPTILWSIDRNTFNVLVKSQAMMEKRRYESFLGSVSVFEGINDIDRAKLADVLRPMSFKDGDVIFRCGEAGSNFFLIVEGRVTVTKRGQEVFEYGEGDYFGERALLKDEPRAADVQAITELKLLALDRLSFERILGPLDRIWAERMASYT